MRIAYLSVSDQLGGSEIVLLEIIKGIRRLRPAWTLQVILPGRGPLLDDAEAAGAAASCFRCRPHSRAWVSPVPAPLRSPPASCRWRSRFLPTSIACTRSSAPAVPPSFIPTDSRHTSWERVRPAKRRSCGTCTSISVAGVLSRALLARHQRRVRAVLANSRKRRGRRDGGAPAAGSRARGTQRGGPEHLRPGGIGRRISIAAPA